MKIVYKKTKLSQAFMAASCLLAVIWTVPGFAADSALPSMPVPSLPQPASQPPSVLPTLPGTPPPVSSNESAPGLPGAKNDKTNKSMDALDIKVPDSVKDAIKKLDAAENVTLEDLNSARQAIAKIDALIEIEKKLSELDKLRQEHETANKPPLAAAIPASAINALPVPSLPQFASLPSLPSLNNNHHGNDNPGLPPIMPEKSNVEINRIIGSGGHYAALVKNGDQTKVVQVGDKFDGGTVLSISVTGVEIDDGKATRTIHVKNVENIFGDSH